MGRRRKGGAPRGPRLESSSNPGPDPGPSRVERWLKGAFDAHGAGNPREAERLARRVIDAVPDQPDALHLLATIARESGRTDLAIDRYRRLLRRHPAIPIAQNGLGNLLQERRELKEAIACYEAALAHDPRYASAHFNLGCALLFAGDPIRAEACLRRAAALAPDDAPVRSRLGRALIAQDRKEEAIAETLRSIELDPDSADLRNDLGVIHSTIGDFDAARECYRTALALDPGYVKAALNLAKSGRLTTGDDADAARIRAVAEHGSAHGAMQRDLHLALGKIHDDRGEWDTAFAHYAQANRPLAASALEEVDASLALMDRTRAFFDASWFAALPPATCPDPTPVFIVGMPRSGTTLVEQILAAHPAVHGAGELHALAQLVSETAARIGGQEPYPAWVRALGAEETAALGGRYLAHLRTHSLDAARVTDKLPGNYLHLGFIATILPGARFIHCRRDPFDNAISLYFTDFEAGRHKYSYDLRAIGRQIRGMRALMAHWEAMLGEHILTVDYEALVADPEPLARAMIAHVDLAWDDACLRPHEVARAVHTASAWQVRQPVYQRSAGRAQRYEQFLEPLREALDGSPAD